MDGFGRVLDTTNLPQGGLIDLESQPPFAAYPSIDHNHAALQNALPMSMNDQMLEPLYTPTNAIYTELATGGCVPICAAEITPAQGTSPRTVRWIYLLHATGRNLPKNVSVWAEELDHVYVCMMVHSGASASLQTAAAVQSEYFARLDPTHAIPNANALLIYGTQSSLVITQTAQIALLT